MAVAQFCPSSNQTGNFWQTVGIPARGAILYQSLHDGFSFDVFSKLGTLAQLDRTALAKATTIAPATLQRRMKSGRFSREESDRLYRFASILKAATDLFEGNIEDAAQWLKKPVRGLGNKAPVSMLQTTAETQAVIDLIGRLEHGVHT